MALSGTLSTEYRGWTYRVEWSASQSVSSNTSTITCRHYLDCGSGYDLYISSRTNSCTVGGVTNSFTSSPISTSGSTTISLGTTTHTVGHGSNGALQCAVSATFNIKATLSGTYVGSMTVSGTITLDTIPRGSGLTASNGTLGMEQTLTISRASSSFIHTLEYKCGSVTGIIATKTSVTSIKWTPPIELASQNTTGPTVHVVLTLTTYSGGSYIGSSTKTINCGIPDSVSPSCSLSLEDVTGLQTIYGFPVQGLSRLKITVTPTLSYESPIESYTVSCDGVQFTTAETTTGPLNNVGNSKITATVKDKRGRSGSAEMDLTVLPYTPPFVSELSVHRCDEDGEENDQGEYIKVTFSAAVSALNNKNTASYTLRYKKSVDPSFTETPIYILENLYTITGMGITFPADGSNSYDVEIEAKDAHGADKRGTSASTAFTIINWGSDGASMAIGKVAEKPNTLEIALATEVYHPIQLTDGGKRPLTLTADFKPYNNVVANSPWCRKTAAGVVEVWGIVSPTKADNVISSLTPTAICVLPEGLRPAQTVYQLCQGSDVDTWVLSVMPDGSVNAILNRSGNASTNPTTSAWMVFHAMFIADQ